MCHKQITHYHCENCNKDLYPNQKLEANIFCASAKTNQLDSIHKCTNYQPQSDLYVKSPMEDCLDCVMKRRDGSKPE